MTADATPGSAWWLRLAVTLLILLAIGTVLVTNRWLSERFTETTRNRAELRLALYSGNVLSELQRTSVVPLLLADDPAIRDALGENFTLIDLGCGSCAKAGKLFHAGLLPARYIAVDISVDFLRDSLQNLKRELPAIDMTGLGLDFTDDLRQQLARKLGAANVEAS